MLLYWQGAGSRSVLCNNRVVMLTTHTGFFQFIYELLENKNSQMFMDDHHC